MNKKTYTFIFEYSDIHVKDYIIGPVSSIELFPESVIPIDFPKDPENKKVMKLYSIILDDYASILYELPPDIKQIRYMSSGPYIVRVHDHDIFKVNKFIQADTCLNLYKLETDLDI